MSTDFEYFDQFLSVEINLNPYLTAIKEDTGYDYQFTNIQPVKVTLANIFDKIILVKNYQEDALNFDTYTIGENETIEVVSYNAYGTVDNWWVIAIFNNIKNLFTDWPLPDSELVKLSESLFQTEKKYTKQTYYELLVEKNDSKRNIILPNPTSINPLIGKFRQVFDESLMNVN